VSARRRAKVAAPGRGKGPVEVDGADGIAAGFVSSARPAAAASRLRHWLRPVWIVLALAFLFEAWLWDRLQPLVAYVVYLVAWKELRDRIAALLEHLPPAAALVVFVIPGMVLFPLKLLGLWLLATGSWLGALSLLAFAKIVGVGVTAFVFNLTRDKLLQLDWFRWVFDRVMAIRDWAHALIDPIHARMTHWVWLLKPRRAGRLIKRLIRLRRRVQRA